MSVADWGFLICGAAAWFLLGLTFVPEPDEQDEEGDANAS